MEADKDMELEPDYKGFRITIESLNPAFKTNKDGETAQTATFYGSGYCLFVSEEDGVSTIKHGHNLSRMIVCSMVEAAGKLDELPALLSDTIKKIVDEGKMDVVMKYLQSVALLHGWGKVWQIL